MKSSVYTELRTPERAVVDPQVKNLWYSLRRYYVDDFHLRHVPELPADSLVLDLGGTKTGKRGQFDIGRYPLRVLYANLLTDKKPDVQCDAALLPFHANCFDAIVCSEVLEYLYNPVQVLHEMRRVLKSGETLLICVPFLYRIQGHPYDYGRYTNLWWGKRLSELGFTEITIEWQGFFASVFVDMLRDVIEHKGGVSSQVWRKFIKWGGRFFLKWAYPKALEWDERVAKRQDAFAEWCCSYTSGFGIRAVKA